MELRIPNIEDITEIKTIKITNVSVWKTGTSNDAPLLEGVKLVLFAAD